MGYTDIFEGCTHSIGGIKDFYIATRDTDGKPLSFPLDVVLKSGSTDTILLDFDYSNRIVTINNTEIAFRHVYPDTSTYTETQEEVRQGNTFKKVLKWSMPKVNLTTNNQLKEFLFTADGEFAVSNALVFFTDINNQNWIAGFDIPFVLENFELKIGAKGAENQYNLEYVSSGYLRTYKFEVI